MEAVEVDGLKSAYERSGSGESLVLLHGILSDSREWRTQLDALSDQYDVVAPDLPGCGASDDPPESFRLPDYAAWLSRFLTNLGIERAHVGGLSWGGVLALGLYHHEPQRVASLILADTYAGWNGSLPPETVAERLASCLRESYLPADEFIPAWMPGLVSPGAPSSLQDDLAAVMREFHPVGYRVMAHSVAEADLSDVLPAIRVPTLLVWGENDARSPLPVAQSFAAAIRGSSLAIIPDCGHVSNREAPEAFNTAIREFLQRL